MAYSAAGSSSDAAQFLRGEYEVFLSFRGPDTRYGFTDFLYHGLIDAGVRVFKDEDDLRVGEVIDENLRGAINNSILYIPIFSQTYAFSQWCLRELAFIVDNVSMSEGKKSILPVFLDVEPEDVILKTPLYSSALLKHKKTFPREVEAWKAALAKVGEINGWNCRKDQSQAVIVKLIVNMVLEKLKKKIILVPEDIVGLEDQIKDLIQLLDVNNPDVRLIGIYGMGGIASLRAFVTTDGLVSLQKKLLSDIDGSGFVEKINDNEEGMRRIEVTLSNKKVLLILDDVDQKESIKNLTANFKLHGGSRIIITTRDYDILHFEGFEVNIYLYEMQKMDDCVALQLFCRHAFRKDCPSDDYYGLSSKIVSCTGGVPLAIEVVGSFLKQKDKAFWEETLAKLSEAPEEDIVETLRISYDSLDKYQQQIFLDIACFFFNKDKEDAIYMWDSCQFYPTRAIEVLTQRSLINTDNGKLWMHDQLIALGRQIVREDSLGDLGKQSRLWIAKEAFESIKSKERKDEVQALEIDGLDDSIEITNEELERLPNLRFLKLGNGTFVGDFTKCRSKLRWISWCSHRDFRAENLYLDHLVVFKLDKNGFTNDSKAWDLIKRAQNLKVLSLTECDGITTIPDFSKCSSLERLTLAHCVKLKKIEKFIGDLPSLIELEIEWCKDLADLPEEVGALAKLERFSLSGCFGLRELPNSIGNIISLIELDLSCTGIAKLPNHIQKLVKLESLLLRDTRIMELPTSIEKLKSLRILHLTINGFSSPEHVWQLPSGISKLKNLEELDLSGHVEIKGEILIGIGELLSLRILSLRDCHGIQVLPELPSSLTCLLIQSKSLLLVPNLSNLTNLVELLLSDNSRNTGKSNLLPGHDLRWIGRLSRLEKLALNLLNVDAPQELASLSHLKELTLSCLDLETLVQLSSSHWNLVNLSTLEFYHCEVEDIPFDRLPQLEKLTIDGCKRLERLSIPLELGKLHQVWVSHCPELHEIQIVGLLKSLESLMISECKSLIRISGLSYLKNLEKLVIQQCKVLNSVEGLEELEALKSLVVQECTNIPDDRLLEIQWCGDFIKQDVTSLMHYREEPLLNTSNKSMERMKDEARQQAAGVKTSDKNCAFAAVQNVVGIDDRVRQITNLLEIEVNDEVRIIGIYGTDGIGKTTLAKAVYDCISSCFDSCSFLAEVEETTQNHGIQFLQTKLIRDILERDHEDPSFDERVEDFLDIFREMKVLIVVDDVESQLHLHAIVGDQLHWFGLGSRIIVTSKKRKILKDYDPGKARSYMVHQLDNGQAFELFCKHAFGMQSSIHAYDGLPNRIVNATLKLPLVVEVIGSFLRGKPIEEWKKMEESMKQLTTKSQKTTVDWKKISNICYMALSKQKHVLDKASTKEWKKMEVLLKQSIKSSQKTTVGSEEILDICYKALDPKQKHVFLDIACFISGVDARIASYMWPNSYLPSSDCILMPLAKIGENDELQMHRLLRCLGKRISKQEESQDPKSIRFCTQDMILKAMNREMVVENVEARDLCILTAANFDSMPAISFLKLDDAKLSGDFARAFPSLRWLCWQRVPLEFDAFNFVLRELVILDLSWSKVTEDWGGWSIIKMKKLKVLNLTGCSDLLITPNFSDYKNLEILILERCSHLVKLDPSIGHLNCLVSLNLKFCSQLNRLPVELGCMTALKELFIDGTSVREIPFSIGNLKQLKILTGFECLPLTHLPSSICYLTALSELSLHGAAITELPSSLGGLVKLRRLSLRDCRYLEELPDSIGKMGSLEELDISETSISRLPNSIRNLQKLMVLRMDSSFIRAFPGEIGNLTKLEELHASWCRSLKGAIPNDIRELRNLRSLTLGHSRISSLPSEISTIPGLHTLDLLQCNEIEELPKLPPSIIRLRVSSRRMKVIPLLKGLKELEELCLSDGDLKVRRPPSKRPMPESNVKQMIDKPSFSISFPKLTKLELSLSQIIKLKFEPTDIPQRPTLPVSSLKIVSELPKTLSVFELYNSAIEEIEGLEGLEGLKRLDISNCKINNLDGIGQLTSLRSLILSHCDDLSFPDLSKLKSLKVLEIRQCKMIRQIEGLEKLTSLEKLKISECPAENSVQVQNALKHVMAHSTVT